MQHVNRGPRDAVVIGASLTLALGILSHLIVETAVTGDRLELFTRSHAMLALLAVAVLGWSIVRIGGGDGRGERRRNTALLRSALRADTPAFYLLAGLFQAGIAAAILVLEGIAIAPGQMLTAALSGVLALVAGSVALRLARRRIVAVLAMWVRALADGALVPCAAPEPGPARIRTALRVLGTRPDRAPPAFLIA